MKSPLIGFLLAFLVGSALGHASPTVAFPPLRVTDESSALTVRTTLDFTGAGVSCADTGSVTQCTIAGISTPVSIANGGTNGSATPTGGAVAYGTGTAYAFSAVGSAGDCLKSGAGGAPTWGSCSSISAYGTIQDEGTPLTARTTVNFIGSAVTCADNGGTSTTDCTVTGGGTGLTFGETQRLAFMAN